MYSDFSHLFSVFDEVLSEWKAYCKGVILHFLISNHKEVLVPAEVLVYVLFLSYSLYTVIFQHTIIRSQSRLCTGPTYNRNLVINYESDHSKIRFFILKRQVFFTGHIPQVTVTGL